jgi:S-adenosyl methyltransferase
MSGYQDTPAGDLIGERAAAWDAGDTGRAEEIDAELNARLRAVLRTEYPHKLRPARPDTQPFRPGQGGRGGQGRAQDSLPSRVPGRPPEKSPLAAASRAAGLSEDSMLSFDASVPNVARIYNTLLGGKDNFQPDREAAEKILQIEPRAAAVARQNREFLRRVVRFLAGEAGIRQFLDIGSGLPTASNVHEVAQEIAPESRVVYVDNDSQVLVHARALLTSAPQGRTAYVGADLRDTDTIIEKAAGTLNLAEPVAVLLIAIMHFIPDADDPWAIARRLMDALPPGSYLAISHAAPEHLRDGSTEKLSEVYAKTASGGVIPRPLPEIQRFFDGLELAEPGVTGISAWRPAVRGTRGCPDEPLFYGGAGRKPEGSPQ